MPLALFGREGYANLMGRIAPPTLIVQATSPSIGAWLLNGFGSEVTLAVLLAGAVLNSALVLRLLLLAPRKVPTVS